MNPQVKSLLLAGTAVLLAAVASFVSRSIDSKALRTDLFRQVAGTREALLAATLGAPSIENVEASIVADILNTSPYTRQLALIAKHKKVLALNEDEIGALVRYDFATFNLPNITLALIEPLIQARKSLVEAAFMTVENQVVEIKEFDRDEEDQLERQKEAADVIMMSLRKTVLVAAYLHERAGRRALALHYYEFYMAAAKRMMMYFNYFRSTFAQDLLTVSQFKVAYLKHAVPALRQEYARLSYFNMVIEDAVQSVFKHDVFDRYREKGWLGGNWNKVRTVELDTTTFQQPYIEFESGRLFEMTKDIELSDDPFLFFEVCASIWANAEGNENEQEHLCPLQMLQNIGLNSKSHLIGSLAYYLYLRATEARNVRVNWGDAQKMQTSLEVLAQSLELDGISDWLKDDVAYMIFTRDYQKNFERARPAFVSAFPFGRYDATPAIIELD